MDAKDGQIFMKRRCNIFAGQRRRAEKAGATLDFNLLKLQGAVLLRIGTNCEHCQQPITVRNFSVDHREPTSRRELLDQQHGDRLPAVQSDQGSTNSAEFDALLECISEWHEQAKRSLLARLRRTRGRLCPN